MKKLFVLLAFLVLVPLSTKALEPNYTIDGFYVNADVLENGDMLVKEQIVQDGAFNGYVRDLSYRGNYQLYDASKLDLIRVCEVSPYMSGRFDLTNGDLTCFTKNAYASKGDSHVFQRFDTGDIVSLTMYNYNESGARTYYIEYVLKNVVVVHNDVAELYWTFIGNNFSDDINHVKITINLPSASSDLRVWVHGPLYGNVERKSDKQIIATVDNLYANTLVDIRSTFDKNVVPSGTKLSNDNALSDILETEQKRADEANQQREQARIIYYGMIGLNGVWLAFAIVLAIYAYRKYDKEHKSNFKLEYHREFPAEYGPEVVEYLMKKSITPLSLSAMILNIISKKGFDVRESEGKRGKKEYILIKKDIADNKLTAEEKYIVDWLINDCGNGSEVSLKEINDASSTNSGAKGFVEKYDKWVKLSKINAMREEFYEDSLGFKIKGCLYAISGFGLFILSTSLEVYSIIVFITLFASIALFIYIVSFTRRTIKGNDHYVKWKAFKKFLLDFGRFNEKELPEVVLWEKYLVYATVFGIADKVSKAMEIKASEMHVDTGVPMYSHLYMNYYFSSHLVNTINTTRSASVSQIARSSNSSGSGFGGGFSGGGGFGGGGGGGGGHGF